MAAKRKRTAKLGPRARTPHAVTFGCSSFSASSGASERGNLSWACVPRLAQRTTAEEPMGKSTQKKSKGFDITTRYAKDSLSVPIMDPTNISVDTGARIIIRSLYSEEARTVQQNNASKIAIKDGKVQNASAFNSSIFEQTIAVTIGWENIEEGDKEIPFTADNVRRLYTDPRTAWVQKQVEAAYLNISGFFEKPRSN
jgi:hypothetical protein